MFIHTYIYRRRPRGVAPPPFPFLQGLGPWALAFVADEMLFGSFVRRFMRSWLTGASSHSTSQLAKQPSRQPANQPTSELHQKWDKMGAKSSPNPASWGPKSCKIWPGDALGRLWASSWPKMAPRAKKNPKMHQKSTKNGPNLKAKKSTENRPRSGLKCDDQFLERLVAKLGPTWEPKPCQHSAKFVSKSNQIGAWL